MKLEDILLPEDVINFDAMLGSALSRRLFRYLNFYGGFVNGQFQCGYDYAHSIGEAMNKMDLARRRTSYRVFLIYNRELGEFVDF